MFEPLDWALARAPLLPIEAYPRAQAAGELRIPADGRVRAALAIGSPDLYAALLRAQATGLQAARVRSKLHRYLIRMATRPTPYGLFAGVGLSSWGPSSDLRIAAGDPRTQTRPDMEWLLGLVSDLEHDLAVRRELRLIANPALLIRAGRVFLPDPGPDLPGKALSLRATGAVRHALELARRPIRYHELVAAMTTANGATNDRVEGLISELCELGVLQSDLRPPLTCANPARHVRDRLASVPAASSAADGLDGLLEALMSWDALKLGDRPGKLAGLRRRADDIHPVPASSTALQVDMALALAGRCVHSAVAGEVALAGELLLRMSPYPDGPPHLHAYREAFEARYGAGRAVPLIELLDPHFGLGPPESHHSVERRFDPPPDPRRELALQELALRAQRKRLGVVQLDDELLEQLETWSPDVGTAPLSLDISAFVAARSATALDAGDFQVIVGPNLGVEGAGRNTGRFAELLGADATAALIRTANAEAERAPRSLGVELVCAPVRARWANVSIRPVVRRHEIVLGAMPGVAWEQVVPLDELVVTVRQGSLRVYWPRADAELAVRQGHLLNPLLAPPIARFLNEFGSDRRVQLRPFSWGSAGAFPFLPRVQRGRAVLSLAQWRVSAGSHPDGLAAEPAGSFAKALAVWRAQWSVPSHVYLASGDNRLLLDLDDEACAGLLREELRRLPADELLLLEEALPGPDHAWLPGPTGHHLLELVVPLVLRSTVERKSLEHASAQAWPSVTPSVSRLRPPGSDWLYLKLYAPAMLHEQLLAGPVRELAEFARSAGLTDGWFFIRYADPEPHLRIRFRGEPSVLLGTLLDQLCTMARTLVSDGACQRFSFETYEREIERFGGEHGMTIAEAIFASDSVAVADLLSASRGTPELDRLTLAVLSIDDLLAALGLTESERRIWYRNGASIASEDGREYRRRQAELRRLLSDPNARPALPAGATVREIFAARRDALRSASNALDSAKANGLLHTDKATLCASYVHLHCNRVLPLGSPVAVQALKLLRRAREGLAHYPHA